MAVAVTILIISLFVRPPFPPMCVYTTDSTRVVQFCARSDAVFICCFLLTNGCHSYLCLGLVVIADFVTFTG